MTNIRRYFAEGQTCFLTHITHNRRPVLVDHFDLLWQALDAVQKKHGLVLNAWAVMPDHIHMLVDLNQKDISGIVRRFKLSFSTNLRARLGMREGRIWQYRLWDRIMRDQEDLNKHINYVHYNPVKHGLIDDPFGWKYSSAAEYLKAGYYAPDWGVREPIKIEGDFGE